MTTPPRHLYTTVRCFIASPAQVSARVRLSSNPEQGIMTSLELGSLVTVSAASGSGDPTPAEFAAMLRRLADDIDAQAAVVAASLDLADVLVGSERGAA
jgi:hypothetical protein